MVNCNSPFCCPQTPTFPALRQPFYQFPIAIQRSFIAMRVYSNTKFSEWHFQEYSLKRVLARKKENTSNKYGEFKIFC